MPFPLRNRHLLFGAAPNLWTGATWALDGSGRAYNTPTLGSELLTNGGFDSDLSGWSSEGGVGSQSWVSGTLRNVYISGSTYSSVQSKPTTAGQWLRASVNVLARTNSFSNLKLRRHTGSAIIAQSINAPSAPLPLTVTARALDTPTYVLLSNGTGTTDWDDASLKVVTLPTTVATIAGTTPTQTAACKIHTLTTGTQAGVVSLLDSASSPANFLIGYHDGTNVKLDKCVGGTYTNLINTAVAFSSTALASIVPIGSNQFQLWYNGSQRGSTVTVSDAGIVSNTLYGLFSTYSGNLFTEFSLDGAVIPFGF